jgi:hypothetical protein
LQRLRVLALEDLDGRGAERWRRADRFGAHGLNIGRYRKGEIGEMSNHRDGKHRRDASGEYLRIECTRMSAFQAQYLRLLEVIRIVQVPLACGLARLVLQLILLVRLIHAFLGRSAHRLEAAQLARKVSGLVGCWVGGDVVGKEFKQKINLHYKPDQGVFTVPLLKEKMWVPSRLTNQQCCKDAGRPNGYKRSAKLHTELLVALLFGAKAFLLFGNLLPESHHVNLWTSM